MEATDIIDKTFLQQLANAALGMATGNLNVPDVRNYFAIHCAALELLERQRKTEEDSRRSKLRVYKNDANYLDYLHARFNLADHGSFEWNGQRWKYEYTDFDIYGDFDVLLGVAPSPPR
jgi:hypothetical protein